MNPYKFWYCIAGLFVGLCFLGGGLLLLWYKRSSDNIWRLMLGDMHIEISTKAPGVILATLGLLVIYFTRPG